MKGSFTKQLEKFADDTDEKHMKIVRKSAFDLFSAVVMGTPVDKGTLRNNWFANVGTPSNKQVPYRAPKGAATLNRIAKVIRSMDMGDSIYLTNNLPYAMPIEYDGHSQKAAQGMVRINVARWDEIVRNNTAQVK